MIGEGRHHRHHRARKGGTWKAFWASCFISFVDSVGLTCCVMVGRDGLFGLWRDGWMGGMGWDDELVWEKERMFFCKADGVL